MSSSCRNPTTVALATGYTLGPIGAAVVLLWVGFWGLLDTYLYPEDPIVSAAVCVGIAIVLTLVCHAWTLSSLSTDNSSFICLTAALGVFYWRGVWELWESLVFVDRPFIQFSSALVLGVVILMLSGNFHSHVVGPPILFPQPQIVNPSSATMDGEDHKADLTSPLHDAYNEEETMIAMADVVKGNSA